MSRWSRVGVPGVFEQWIVEMRGLHGVYAIRDATTHEVQRHFQSSSRGYHGPNYNREGCEATAEACAAADVEDLQAIWIARLKPRDNEELPLVMVAGEGDEVPF